MAKYQINDEEFSRKSEAIARRILLNKEISKANKESRKEGYISINVINKVLKGRGGKWLVRPYSIRN